MSCYWGIALCSLIFLWRFHFQALGAFVTPIIFLVIGYAAMQSKEVAVVGFVCVIFTYIGVNTLLPGIHSYA